jgi:hypothetical protein
MFLQKRATIRVRKLSKLLQIDTVNMFVVIIFLCKCVDCLRGVDCSARFAKGDYCGVGNCFFLQKALMHAEKSLSLQTE